MLLDALQPIVDLVQPALLKLSVLVGGIFGLYLLLLFFRVHYERKKVRILQDIRYDLDKLNILSATYSKRISDEMNKPTESSKEEDKTFENESKN